MPTSEQRLADAAERIATALEYFMEHDKDVRGLNPAPEPQPLAQPVAPVPAPQPTAEPEAAPPPEGEK